MCIHWGSSDCLLEWLSLLQGLASVQVLCPPLCRVLIGVHACVVRAADERGMFAEFWRLVATSCCGMQIGHISTRHYAPPTCGLSMSRLDTRPNGGPVTTSS
jgi:hypothetical protein